MDSFGNALGNAAVAGLRDAEETAARNKYIQEMGQQISANAAKVVNEGAQRAMDNSMSGIAKQQREKDTNKIMEAQGRITQGNNDAQFAAEEAKRAARSQSLAQRSNERSAQTRLAIQDIDNQSAMNAKARAEQSALIADRYARRTEAFREQNPVYQSPEGILESRGIDVAANVAWADSRRAAMLNDLGLSVNAPSGGFWDSALWYGGSIVNEGWQGMQFLGKAAMSGYVSSSFTGVLANKLTSGGLSNTLNPFNSSNYHSLIGDDTLLATHQR